MIALLLALLFIFACTLPDEFRYQRYNEALKPAELQLRFKMANIEGVLV